MNIYSVIVKDKKENRKHEGSVFRIFQDSEETLSFCKQFLNS